MSIFFVDNREENPFAEKDLMKDYLSKLGVDGAEFTIMLGQILSDETPVTTTPVEGIPELVDYHSEIPAGVSNHQIKFSVRVPRAQPWITNIQQIDFRDGDPRIISNHTPVIINTLPHVVAVRTDTVTKFFGVDACDLETEPVMPVLPRTVYIVDQETKSRYPNRTDLYSPKTDDSIRQPHGTYRRQIDPSISMTDNSALVSAATILETKNGMDHTNSKSLEQRLQLNNDAMVVYCDRLVGNPGSYEFMQGVFQAGSSSKETKGLFIVFEGMDCSGKTTQSKLLAEALQHKFPDREILLTHEPGDSRLGAHLRNILKHEQFELLPATEMLLFMADRLEHLEKVIIPALTAGKIVICDRFSLSTYAYQAIHDSRLKSVFIHLTKELVEVDPDYFLVLDLPFEKVLTRLQQRDDKLDNIETRNEGYLKRTINTIANFFGEPAKTLHPCSKVFHFDATMSIENLHREICDTLKGI